MKKRVFDWCRVAVSMCMLGAGAGGLWAGETAARRKTVSTTIDFLDYCFYRTDAKVGYFTRDQYEEVIRSLARAGISKVYLRVDVCGKTLYPSKAGVQYMGDGREPGSTYLVNTLKHYDPVAATIELGHRVGLEVWCWDTLFDDEATMVHYAPGSELARRYGEYPLKDPFLVAHPEMQWRLDPRLEAEQKRLAAKRADAGPITAIRIRSDVSSRRNRIRAEDIALYVSSDNVTYRPYGGSLSFTVAREKPPVLVLSDLHIPENYVKLCFKKRRPKDNSFTMAGEPNDFVEVRYDDAWHATMAAFVDQKGAPEQQGFVFGGSGRFAWDYDGRALGICKIPSPMPTYYGMIELAYDAARAHKLAKLKELAAYEFDGFAYSLRTHSQSADPRVYGFGKPIRDAFRQRYGVDIWTQDFDHKAWLALRADSIDRTVREAAALLRPRPLFMDSPKQGSSYLRPYGGVPLRARAWVKGDGVAGIRFLGYGPGEVLRPKLPEAKPGVRVVRFVDNGSMPPLDVFRQRLTEWLNEPGLDEVEFYETVLYTDHPAYLKAIRDVLTRAKALPASAAGSPR